MLTAAVIPQTTLRLTNASAERLRPLLAPLSEQAARVMEIARQLGNSVKRKLPQRHSQDLPGVIEGVVRLASFGSDSALSVQFCYGAGATRAIFDRVQIEQVLFNLVRNAIEATPAEMRRVLTIATDCAPERMIEISIADNGPGPASGIA